MTLYCCHCRITRDETIGLYVSKNNINTIDTVWVIKDGTYINIMYRKLDNSLIYKNVGKWKVADGYITFDNFFSDEDEIHSKEVTNYEDVLITTQLPLEKRCGKVIMHHIDMYDDIYMEKINLGITSQQGPEAETLRGRNILNQ